MAIPTSLLIEAAPRIFDAAMTAFDKWKNRPRPEPVDPGADPKIQIAGIVARLQALEDAESRQAEVVKNIAGELKGVSVGLDALHRRTRFAIWMAVGALAVSLASLAALAASLLR